MNAGFFPGQGSQQVGMGKNFFDEFTVFRQTIEEASDSLSIDLKKMIFEGPENELLLTENAQPAILAVSTGCMRVAESELGLKLDVNLGHSLGEYSALVACEAIPFSNSIQWVRARGQAMQAAVPVGAGSMAAVIGATDEQVQKWCEQATLEAKSTRASQNTDSASHSVSCTVEPANFNAPGQIVVSGSVDAIEKLEAIIASVQQRGLMCKRLQVSAPFHSSLMKPAREAMDKIFAEASKQNLLSPLLTPYIPNRTAKITQESGVVFPLLSEQVDHSVLWKQSVEHLISKGCTRAFEFGPGKVLQGLAKRIAKEMGVSFETFPIYDVESLKTAEGALK